MVSAAATAAMAVIGSARAGRDSSRVPKCDAARDDRDPGEDRGDRVGEPGVLRLLQARRSTRSRRNEW